SYPRRCPGRLRGEGLLGLPAAVPRAGRDPWAAVPRGRGGGGPRCRAAKGSPTNARARVYARVREERPKGRRLTRVPARIMRAPACTRARGTAKGSPTNAHARAFCAYARVCVGEAPHHDNCRRPGASSPLLIAPHRRPTAESGKRAGQRPSPQQSPCPDENMDTYEEREIQSPPLPYTYISLSSLVYS